MYSPSGKFAERAKLRRRGHLENADLIANKINCMIVYNRKNALINGTSSDVGTLWALLRKTDNWVPTILSCTAVGMQMMLITLLLQLFATKHTREKPYLLSYIANLMLMMLVHQLNTVILIMTSWLFCLN